MAPTDALNPRRDFDPDAPALDGSGIYGLAPDLDSARVVLLPVPWDATTSYRAGAHRGPAAILAASRQVDLFDIECGQPWQAGIVLLDEPAGVLAWNVEAREAAERVIAAGGLVEGDAALEADLARVNALSARLDAHVRAESERWLDAGRIVGVVGGDHAVPLGAIAAAAARHPGLGVLHLDAHADLRRAYEGFTRSHASIMYNVLAEVPGVARLVQVGIRDLGAAEHALISESAGRVHTHFDADLFARRAAGENWSAACARIVKDLPDKVWLSFDIDGLDPALCPNTGTPVPGGLSFAEACYLVRTVAASGRTIIGFDLDEVAPGPDGDEWDANVGARLLYKMIGWTLRSQPGSR